MSKKSSIQTILEILNRNKIDLAVTYDQIANNVGKFAKTIQTLELTESIDTSLGNIATTISKCDSLIEFWSLMRLLSGGIQFQEFQDKILTKSGTLRLNLHDIGINFLRNNQSRPYTQAKSPLSLSRELWDDIVELLRSDNEFITLTHNIRILQEQNYDNQLALELQNILRNHPELTQEEKEEFSKAYRDSGVSINEFFKIKSPASSKSSPLNQKPSDKDSSKPDFDNYHAYLDADEREMARMKRTGDYSVRKRGKNRKRRKSP